MDQLLLGAPSLFSDGQVWALVSRLRMQGVPLGSSRQSAAVAATGAGDIRVQPCGMSLLSAQGHEAGAQGAGAEDEWEQQLQAVGVRLARHFETLEL